MKIVTRPEWKARPPKAIHKIAKYQPKLILHHTAGAVIPGDDTVSLKDLQRIRSTQNYHMDTRGWNDIAYSFLTDTDGIPFEGRGIGVANGATLGHGASSYAICVMGHFDIQKPDADLLEGLAQLVAWGYKKGLWPLGFTGGHRDYGETSCPGKNLYPYIPSINARAKAIVEGGEEEMNSAQEAKLDALVAAVAALSAKVDAIPQATWKFPQKDDPAVDSTFQMQLRTYLAAQRPTATPAQLDAAVAQIIDAMPEDIQVDIKVTGPQ